MFKKILISLSVISTVPLLSVSCVDKNKIEIKTYNEMAKILNNIHLQFKPIFVDISYEELSKYTIEDLWIQNKILWTEFQKEFNFNNKKIFLFGKLIEIAFSNTSKEVTFKYLWKTDDRKIELTREYHLNIFKQIIIGDTEICHYGHCHKPNGVSIITVINEPFIGK
ncbi:hypothetical protein [Mycoplasma buteonis]|uniref:hypothetical protein n=1 Tax=Mycoplasma buteonis TaxID=171280 RepID=UPI00056BB9F9|nr:hypothetical protein [Mycoplasma buteonis]